MRKILVDGITLIHEHTTIDLSGVKKIDDTNLNCFDESVAEFKKLYELGVRNIVDVTADGMGRNVEYVEKVQALSGINIVQATGYYKEPFLPEYVYTMSIEALADKMVDEIENGIGTSKVKAGVIGEIGTSKDVFEAMEKKVFEAAVLAAKRTGCVISTHTSLSTLALEQAQFFMERGLNPNKIIIGHQDLLGDINQINQLIDLGFYVGFDTIGKNNYFPDTRRAELLYELQESGRLDHICISLDITRKSNMEYKGGIGYSYLLTDFIPLMLEKGVTQASIDKLLIENPHRLFGEI
jgi:phosphotriesterase-related protein